MADNNQLLQAPRGTYDALPEEQKYWRFIKKKFNKRCENFNFSRIDTPFFEYANLFTRSIGETSDIVSKEMFYLAKRGEGEPDLVLRPEGTAGIVRTYIEHGMQNLPKPVKLYYFGPMFRYSRPQSGRFRQFFQLGFEIFGEDDPCSDVLAILLSFSILKDLKLTSNVILEINSLGCKICQKDIRKTLTSYFNQYKEYLCPECFSRLAENPLRILDCKQQRCQSLVKSGPQIVDHLCQDCKEHLQKVLEGLDELGITYDLNPSLVRGLDYYTRTVFEFRDKADETRQSSLGGGGRYDNLVEQYGGPATPAVGFAAGVERIISKLKEYQVKIPDVKTLDVFLIQIGDKARKKVLTLVRDLTNQGFSINCSLGKDSLKSQLRSADKFGTTIALIIGQREALDDSVILRNMLTSSQQTVKINKLENILKKQLLKAKQAREQKNS